MGGRLNNAPIPYNQQHPIILSGHHPLTTLIIQHEHIRLLHAGCQSVVASLRNRYWPLPCKTSVKKVLGKCVKCFRVQPTGTTYIMGNLPANRVTPMRPFLCTGVDYAGPVFLRLKTRGNTTTKAYICVFVCFATKAVHLELSHDLSTNAFLNCLRRFISRRGRCQQLYSDHGTNFVGARNELQDVGRLLASEGFQNEVRNFLCQEQISWHLIPPHAPNFGGLWERAVRSAKHHLKRVVGETRLTYEEMYTLLTQIEACMNSRPLSPLSNDPNDLTPLTPAHFLIGQSLMALPETDVRDIKVSRLDRYQHIQYMLQHFWQRWQQEYLHQLQPRHKWSQVTDNHLRIGTMVIVHEDNLPPMKWQLGRITDLHPGSDGTTRVVSIKLRNRIIQRPVSKVHVLPIDHEINNSEQDQPTGGT